MEVERRRRILLSLWAYAYEFESVSLVSDAKFDEEALLSDPAIETGHLDDWWRKNFQPHTGQWVRSHPEMGKLRGLYRRHTTANVSAHTSTPT